MRIGMFDTHADAKTYMKNNKSLFKSSIIIDDCTNDMNLPLLSKKNNIKQEVPIQKIENIVDLEAIPKIENRTFQKTLFDTPAEKDALYDEYTFSSYFKELFKEDEGVENSYYLNEITKIEHLIREDKYNSNLHLTASAKIEEDKSVSVDERTLDTDLLLKWEYRLYDGQMGYIYNQIRRITEQGGQLTYEDAKNNLAVLASDLYGNTLFSQTIVATYKKLYVAQENLYDIIYENRKKGLATIIDEIDAKNDLLELEKRLYNYEVEHSRNTYILKSSMNSKSQRPIYVAPLNITESNYSKEEETKLVVSNNPSVRLAENDLKDKKALILSEAGRRMPTVDLNAFAGISESEDLLTDVKLNGEKWGAGITIDLPLYQRNDIHLSEQRAKVLALESKNRLKIATKAALSTWDNHKKNTEQLTKLNKILKTQLIGQEEKLKVIRKQYLSGKADYRYYTDALNSVSLLSSDLLFNIIAQEKRKIFGNYILGMKLYDVSN